MSTRTKILVKYYVTLTVVAILAIVGIFFAAAEGPTVITNILGAAFLVVLYRNVGKFIPRSTKLLLSLQGGDDEDL